MPFYLLVMDKFVPTLNSINFRNSICKKSESKCNCQQSKLQGTFLSVILPLITIDVCSPCVQCACKVVSCRRSLAAAISENESHIRKVHMISSNPGERKLKTFPSLAALYFTVLLHRPLSYNKVEEES